MAIAIVRARVKEGRLEPLEKLDLPDGVEVIATISPICPPYRRGEGLERSFGEWKDLDAKSLECVIRRSSATRPVPKI